MFAKHSRPRSPHAVIWLFLAVLVPACDGDATGPARATDVTVSFAAATSSEAAASPATSLGSGPALSSANSSATPLLIEGTNGTLEISAIHLIVAEIELEGSDGACEMEEQEEGDSDDDEIDDDGDVECPDFDADPSFISVPLDGTAVEVVTDEVAFGTYHEMEFEVEDVELDEEDEDEQELSELRTEILQAFPDWPSEASLLVVGTFTPDGGTAESFSTYFDAEIEVEAILNPPLVLDESGASRDLTVQILPDAWFLRADGSVVDLAALQDQSSLPSLEVEIEEGVEIELDD